MKWPYRLLPVTEMLVSQDSLKRILLVDDEADTRRIAGLTLERIGGFDVHVSHGGREAVRAVDRFGPDLILLDVMMPEMDGIETLTHLRSLPDSSDIPVVFLTARAQPHEVEAYLRAGAAGVITKPFEPATLVDDVRNMWSQHLIE